MPATNIQYLNNSPIQFYKNPASANDKLQGFTTFELTAYDRAQENVCGFITPDFCQYASLNDKYAFQFKASTIGDEIVQDFFTPVLSGTNTSVTTGELVDSGADFAASGVAGSYLVVNTTTNDSSYAVAPIGTTTLDLNEDIFTATPHNYDIYNIRIQGAWKYDNVTGDFFISTPTNNSTLTFRDTAFINTGNWYRVQFTVSGYIAGTLTVNIGNTTLGTISSNGTFTFYGQPTGLNPDLRFVTDATFDATIGDFDVYQLNQLYRIELRDLQDNLIYTLYHTENSISLTMGNVVIRSDWADTIGENGCDCYRFWIYDNSNTQLSDVITNGNFTTNTNWENTSPINSDIGITSGVLRFETTSDSNYDGVFQVLPQLINGVQYTLSFRILNRVSGGVFFEVGGTSTASYSSNGVYSIDITPSNILSPSIFIRQSTSPTQLDIDNVSLKVKTDDLTVDGKSECLRVCNQDDCYTLIQWRNDNNSFGFFYGDSTYYHQMRVLGRLRSQKINDLEFNPFKNSIGQMGFPYYNGQKVEELAISPMPEYMHNALAIGLSHRTILIDGVPYTRAGGYIPDGNDDSELTKVVVEVAKKNQTNLENRY